MSAGRTSQQLGGSQSWIPSSVCICAPWGANGAPVDSESLSVCGAIVRRGATLITDSTARDEPLGIPEVTDRYPLDEHSSPEHGVGGSLREGFL